MTTWILVCDASDARFFMTFDGGRTLHLVDSRVNPGGRLKESDLRSDKPGRIRSRGAVTHVTDMGPHTLATEVEARHFAHLLAEMLRVAHDRHRFDSLIIAAPPHFLGLLRGELDPIVASFVTSSIDKDLTHLNKWQLSEHLHHAEAVA
jgi:protein required for attachment to host cells